MHPVLEQEDIDRRVSAYIHILFLYFTRFFSILIIYVLPSLRCVKSMKSFGFVSPKPGQTRIPISTLSKEKVRKLANLRVI